MNRWRITIVLLIALSIFLILGSAWFEWGPWNAYRDIMESWRPENAYARNYPEVPPILRAVGALFTLFLSGILALFVFPAQVRRMEIAYSSSGIALVRMAILGLLTGILLAAIAISSALTMGTFPLTIILGSVLFLSGFLGVVALAYTLGRILLARADWNYLSPIYALLLGLLILFALGEIPYLGIVLQILFGSLGVGVIIITRFGTGRPWNLSALTED